MLNKRGQVSVFVIIAIVILVGIGIYALVRGNLFFSAIPAEFQPVYTQYDNCITQETKAALNLAGTQGGHIYLEPYIPGSDYAPFASQLNFFGFAVPYWYYVSGNGLIKKQVLTQKEIEDQIGRYVSERVNNCDFETFYAQGFSINMSEASAKVSMTDSKVSIQVNSNLVVSKGENSARVTSHKVDVDSKFGKFYRLAKEIFDKEMSEAFLENYAVDVVNLYAPVDGVELSCAPKIWKASDVAEQIKDGLVANVAALKFKGGTSAANKEAEYFVVDKSVDESVNLMYNRNWPSKIEIYGNNDQLLIAEPVGNQEGLGVMGFCYAPYHFVYDVSFPVMIQIYSGEEIFQFPVVVIVDKNLPRNGIYSNLTIPEEQTPDVCLYKNQPLNVKVYDINLNPVNANISYKCFDRECTLGETKNGVYDGFVQQCVNGRLVVSSEGYATSNELFSSVDTSSAEVVLDKENKVELVLKIDGKEVSSNAIISFSGKRSASAYLPDANKVTLSEGLYNVSVYVYGNSSIVLPASTKTECVDVPESGLLGLFGSTRQECRDITIPETKIEQALIGGGKSEVYILPGMLANGKLTLDVDSLSRPSTLEQLQNNYVSFGEMGVAVQ